MQQDIFEKDSVRMLLAAFTGVKNEEDCRALLEDLLSTKEILDISQRLEVAKMLSEKTVYSRIAEKTGASTATISRVNRSYTYGKGGYQKALLRIEESKKK